MGVLAVITKELIKSEIDNVQDEYLGALYRIVKALGEPDRQASREQEEDEASWIQFIAETYGSLANAPIERGDQGLAAIPVLS